MATLEFIEYVRSFPVVRNGKLSWNRSSKAPIRLPQICWKDGRTWAEANVWAQELATSGKRKLDTVRTSMARLHEYAKWLEREGMPWWNFPAKEEDRCLNQYRGALVRARDTGDLASSTARSRMAATIRFYRWMALHRLISPEWPMWGDRILGIRVKDAFGFEHTMQVCSSDLAIPNRKTAGGVDLEDGLVPVSPTAMLEIVQFAELEASEELAQMLHLGFTTGMRLGSITDLKVQTLLRSSIDPLAGWNRLSLGPGADPPVNTKHDVTGSVPIPQALLDQLKAYSTSTRRLKRQALARPEHRDLLFLTRNGTPYSGAESRAVHVAMGRLRKAGAAAGIKSLWDFNFHRTRPTFATTLMRVALKFLPVADAVELVMNACLHTDEATTFKYVKFIQKSKAMADVSNEYTNAFLGLARPS